MIVLFWLGYYLCLPPFACLLLGVNPRRLPRRVYWPLTLAPALGLTLMLATVGRIS